MLEATQEGWSLDDLSFAFCSQTRICRAGVQVPYLMACCASRSRLVMLWQLTSICERHRERRERSTLAGGGSASWVGPGSDVEFRIACATQASRSSIA